MKSKERAEARSLRAGGLSLNAIRHRVGASKSSINRWVRDVELTEDQIRHLQDTHAIAIEKFSATMRLKREARIRNYYEEADKEYGVLSQNPRFVFGLALYVGEGSKSVEGTIQLGNCDPAVLRYALDFFQLIGFPKGEVRCHIAVHPNRPLREVEKYWQN